MTTTMRTVPKFHAERSGRCFESFVLDPFRDNLFFDKILADALSGHRPYLPLPRRFRVGSVHIPLMFHVWSVYEEYLAGNGGSKGSIVCKPFSNPIRVGIERCFCWGRKIVRVGFARGCPQKSTSVLSLPRSRLYVFSYYLLVDSFYIHFKEVHLF